MTDMQRRFRAVLNEIVADHVPYVLTRDSRPEAAIIPYAEFTQFLAWREQDVLYEFDRAMVRLTEQNAAYGDDEVAADVAAAIAEVRAAPAKP
ncbi:MAG: type II toxin-antitoxin system prevent-host-death family antitoxin [Chloroflexi bacterium]|nr:type II toxin-antitoxin system prevent-host-death family antitoxin [Chloroflexota bacterium]